MWNWLKQYKFTIIAVVLLLLLPFAAVFAKGIGTIRRFEEFEPRGPATIFDRNGKVIASLGQKGIDVSLDQVPQELIDAIVAVEDARFFEHKGFDLMGVLRALWVNLRQRDTVQGASTITQQVAKNLFLHPGKTFERKFEELALAILLESRYSKERILELYLNNIYFGEGAYGVESAAQTYFGKSVSELEIGESTLLAGIPRAPSVYTPYANPDLAKERRAVVLDRMVAVGKLKREEADKIKNEEIELATLSRGQARYFVDWVTNQLIDELGETLVFQGGLKVHTSLDLSLQQVAEEIFAEQEHQGALVALDPTNGEVLTMVGGRNYLESQFNRATQAKRQPGSVFKPLVYAAALKEGFQMNTLVEDIPRKYSDYEPENYSEAYWGPVTMKHAIAFSLNNAAVWTLNEIGLRPLLDLTDDLELGLVKDDHNLATALGGLTEGVTPLGMTASFVPFANGGEYFSPHGIIKAVDFEDNEVFQANIEPKRVLTPQEAYLMTNMLEAVMEYGTGKGLEVNTVSAGKTGTTNEHRELWFIGYTPEIVVGVYIGNDDRSPVEGFGSTTAGPLWAKFINSLYPLPDEESEQDDTLPVTGGDLLEDEPKEEFPVPSGIVTDVLIDVFTGLLANERCEMVELDAFIEGTQPTTLAPCAQPRERVAPQVPQVPEVPEEPQVEEPPEVEEPVQPEPEPEEEEPIQPEPEEPEEPQVPQEPTVPEQPQVPQEPQVPSNGVEPPTEVPDQEAPPALPEEPEPEVPMPQEPVPQEPVPQEPEPSAPPQMEQIP